MDVKRSLPVASAKATDERKWKKGNEGLVGLVNIGNSCYMNAALQALSNCPSFRQFLVEVYHPLPSSHGATGQGHTPSTRAVDVLAAVFKKMWTSDRPPGHLPPRMVSSAMRNKIFRTSMQQDSQEFLRCLLTQIHDETAIEVPPWSGGVATKSRDSPPGNSRRDSMASSSSHDSDSPTLVEPTPLSSLAPSESNTKSQPKTSPLPRKKGLARLSLKQKSNGSSQSLMQGSPTAGGRRFALRSVVHSQGRSRGGSKDGEEICGRGSGSQLARTGGSQVSLETQTSDEEMGGGGGGGVKKSEEGDVYEVDILTRRVTFHRDCHLFDLSPPPSSSEGRREESEIQRKLPATCQPQQQQNQSSQHLRQRKVPAKPKLRSIVTEVFEGVLESRVKCGSCKKVSVVHEPFQDLSLPIPGRKEMAKSQLRSERKTSEPVGGGGGGRGSGGGGGGGSGGALLCTVINLVSQMRDIFSGPETNLHDCLDAFFEPSELKGGNQYLCSQCKKFQNSQKEMIITQLPEVLCIHLKRFRFDAYFSSKISRHIAFPLNDLDMGSYLKDSSGQNSRYELTAIITHYGGAGGGHYVAFAKNSSHNSWFEFNDTRVRPVSPDTVVNTEGYVLFYKRVPPSNSASLLNIELSSLLLPRPGSSVNDPNPQVYLSRHWLHLLRTCSSPGPIFQYEFACEHGAVLPHRGENARSLAMAVRRDVWDTYQQRYGGGPVVPKLEVCSVCKTLLDSYTERRRREKENIHKLQTMCHDQLEKKEPFLLSQRWLSQWQSFINSTTLAVGPPGPVDNSDIIEEVQTDPKSPPQLRLVNGTRAVQAYHKLSWHTWCYIIKTYGGGPVVTTTMTPPPPISLTDSMLRP